MAVPDDGAYESDEETTGSRRAAPRPGLLRRVHRAQSTPLPPTLEPAFPVGPLLRSTAWASDAERRAAGLADSSLSPSSTPALHPPQAVPVPDDHPAAALWWRILDQLPQMPNQDPAGPQCRPSDHQHSHDVTRPAATRAALGTASRVRPEPLKPPLPINHDARDVFRWSLPNPLSVSSGAPRRASAPHDLAARH